MPSPRHILLVLALWAALVLIRFVAPFDLVDNDQVRPASYAVDALVNGQWVVQRDTTGAIASKPPLTTWLIAALSTPGGRVTRLTLCLPSALAMLGTALCVLWAGNRWFTPRAALLAALMLLLSPLGVKHLTLVRTDAVFCLMVTLGALAAMRAVVPRCAVRSDAAHRLSVDDGSSGGTQHGAMVVRPDGVPDHRAATDSTSTAIDPSEADARARAWIPFWLFAALVTLTKGPVGVLFASAGLLSVLKMKPRGTPRKPTLVPSGESTGIMRARTAHIVGMAIYFAIVLAWLIPALVVGGRPFIDKVIGRELVGHVAGGVPGVGGAPFSQFYLPPVYFLLRFAPWSLLAIVGVAVLFRSRRTNECNGAQDQAWSAPAAARFCAFWLVGGMVILAAASHQRADLLLPMIPAASLLAGWMGDRLLSRRTPLRAGVIVCAACALGVLGAGAWYLGVEARQEPARRTAEIARFASQVREAGIDVRTIQYLDGLGALQVSLGTMRVVSTPRQVLDAAGGAAVIVAFRPQDEAKPNPSLDAPPEVGGDSTDEAAAERALRVRLGDDRIEARAIMLGEWPRGVALFEVRAPAGRSP